MDYVSEDLVTGMGKHAGVRDIFQGSGSGSSCPWVGHVGDEPPHGPDPGGFTAQGGPSDHRETSVADSRWKLGVPPLGGGNAGGRFGGGGGVSIEEA